MLTARKITFMILTAVLAALMCALIYTAFFKRSDEGMSGARFIMAEVQNDC